MITVIINWLYMLFTTFCMGYAFACFVEKKLNYRMKRPDSIIMSGVVIATVYAQLFSLFYRVSLLANVIMLIFCLLAVILLRKGMTAFIKESWQNTSVARKAVIAVLFLAWAYYTSRGYIYYDTDLYHAQSIRWIEEYGIVPGLGNLLGNIAYNSSSFAFSALYSMKFVWDYSMHAVSGFFAFLLSLAVLDVAKVWKRKKMLLSDYARIAAIYYLTVIMDEVVSPASDLVVMCTLFYIVIKWLNQLEDEKESKNVTPYALLCVAGVYTLSLKLTAGLILILVIKPAYMLLREKRWKEIALYLTMGIIVAAVWMARTVIISGWLFYPFPELDLFDVDWKMPADYVKLDAARIKTWGRGLYNSALVDMPAIKWIPNWFLSELTFTEKLLIIGDVLSGIIIISGGIWTVIKRKWQNLDKILVGTAILCSYLFWQFSAPLVRYGYAYVLLLTALAAGWILCSMNWRKLEGALAVVLMLYGCYKLYVGIDYIYSTRMVPTYVWQMDNEPYDVVSYEIEGITFYAPTEGERVGYTPFPASPSQAQIELRGDGLEDGFRPKQKP